VQANRINRKRGFMATTAGPHFSSWWRMGPAMAWRRTQPKAAVKPDLARASRLRLRRMVVRVEDRREGRSLMIDGSVHGGAPGVALQRPTSSRTCCCPAIASAPRPPSQIDGEFMQAGGHSGSGACHGRGKLSLRVAPPPSLGDKSRRPTPGCRIASLLCSSQLPNAVGRGIAGSLTAAQLPGSRG
jgi:hypothetical protein